MAKHKHCHPSPESPTDYGKEEKEKLWDASFAICRTVFVITIQEKWQCINDKYTNKQIETVREKHNQIALKKEEEKGV